MVVQCKNSLSYKNTRKKFYTYFVQKLCGHKKMRPSRMCFIEAVCQAYLKRNGKKTGMPATAFPLQLYLVDGHQNR
ncbi:MAG: hypothetical protein BGN88_00490 [Clostridiales bacterium 43-6]|nr:MAG: hypothetical protein BGN88_00490 [Clostridiales bacterium 43-6]